MKSRGVDIFFWITFFLYTNPGGVQQALYLHELGGGLNFNDILFVILSILFFLTPFGNSLHLKKRSKKLLIYCLVYGVYMLLIFGVLTPVYNNNPGSIVFNLIKIRYIAYNIAIVFYLYRFYQRNNAVFYRVLYFSSLTVFILFLQSFITGIDILPRFTLNRGFIDMERQMLYSYGLLPLLIPLGTIVLLGKYKFKDKGYILTLYVLMIIVWLVSITRRHIIGVFAYLIIAFFLINYLKGKRIISLGKAIQFIMVLFVLIGSVAIVTPRYFQTTVKAIEETIYVIQYGETTAGFEDERFGFSRDFIVDKFKENKYFGTGYTQKWQTSDEEGYESYDYPLLSAFAMVGIIGILAFTPIYFLLIKLLLYDIRMIRTFKLNMRSKEFYYLLFFILYFIYNLLQYINWYSPVSVYRDITWYVCLGLYLAARDNYYRNLKSNFDLNTAHAR
ncbi:MAG: hypothetical protein JXB17_02200 [Bacteroidales bacterium]|nr:hypothetical protein [Bacteroidales bacterium]